MQPTSIRLAFGLCITAFSSLASAAPAAASSCNIDFRLASHVTFGALQFRVSYGLADGEFEGEGTGVACTNTSDADLSNFEDNDAARQLTAGFIDLNGVAGPGPLARCRFAGPQAPAAADFTINVIDASDTNLSTITANVTIGAISCSACGDANNDGRITAADALIALRAAVGSGPCALASCDATGDGTITASDALLVLKAAVGTQVDLHCPTNSGTTTTTAPTTTTTMTSCPTSGPLTDLRDDCSRYGYFYELDGLMEGISTNGTTIAVAQTDGMDVLGYYGPVTGARTFTLTHVSMNGSPFYPALDNGSGGNLSADGITLNLVIKISGKTYKFNGATWVDTRPLVIAGDIHGAVAGLTTGAPPKPSALYSLAESLRR